MKSYSKNHTQPFTIALGIAFTILTGTVLLYAFMNGRLDFRSRAAGGKTIKNQVKKPIPSQRPRPTSAPTKIPSPTWRPAPTPTPKM